MRPLVSVIVPTHNGERFLAEAIDSVLEQAYPRKEIIVVDDGSTDGTPGILARYSGRVLRLVGENRGVAHARNRGIAAARGELIAFLDDDDMMLPGKLDAQTEIFERNAGAGMVHSGWTVVDEDGRLLGERRPWVNVPRLDLRGWIMWKPVLPGALMVRRRWLEKAGGFDPAYGGADTPYQVEDLELVLRLARAGCRTAWLERPTVAYRQHGGNAMRRAPAQVAGVVKVLEDFYRDDRLPWSVRRLERAAFYYTHLWGAWYLHRHGFDDEAVDTLRRAGDWLRSPGAYRVQREFAQFARLAAGEGLETKAALGTLPLLRRAAGLDDRRWDDVQRAIRCWVEVWNHYVEGRYEEARAGLEARASETYEELFQVVLQWVLVSASPTPGEAIARFWRDLLEVRPPPAGRRHDEALLHLAGVAQHVWNRRGLRAARALARAVRTGWHPRAAYVWGRFLRTGFVHYVLGDRPATGRLAP